ncbi:BREX-1 system adenine-specific DNA-methyltransferase PglX [bacterium]|nr:BREX-1 system adenine-specific DNA-methyltransferase PglX [bacterium]
MLFARFLAENELLIEPTSGHPISLADCRELAAERRCDWIGLAAGFAQSMLPQIFREDDPVLDVSLPPETRQELESRLEALSLEVFVADDSLGWVYQFWQADAKEAVNASGVKIGADELASVTQLFTEDYMVLFLLHNSLGAWWAGKILAARPGLAREASSEEELRQACAVPGVSWTYLRFVREDDAWRPAAGTHPGWPTSAKELTLLDPCMGSGHFLVFALPILAALRMREESLSLPDAADAVLRDNLFGLELDPRCTQLAAFNLALCAWRMGGYRTLPRLNLACSGLAVSAREEDWAALAGADRQARGTMEMLHALFRQAPILGSLIDPLRVTGPLFAAEIVSIRPLLECALKAEDGDSAGLELAVAAQGAAAAADLLTRRYHLVITNVPYLARGKQCAELRDFCERHYASAKNDLANVFLERCLELARPRHAGVVQLVMPQNWLFLTSYRKQRERLLTTKTWDLLARLGEGGFESAQAAGAFTILLTQTNGQPLPTHTLRGLDASGPRTAQAKAGLLVSAGLRSVGQAAQLANPDCRIGLDEGGNTPLLASRANSYQGITTGDNPHFIAFFWETSGGGHWAPFQSTGDDSQLFVGREQVFLWEQGTGELAASPAARIQGQVAWDAPSVAVRQMRSLPVTLASGSAWDMNSAAIVPSDRKHLPAVWCFCSSPEYAEAVRRIDQKLNVTNATLVKVPFDLVRWTAVANERYPHGLPQPFSDDPTQWIFHGHPFGSVVWDESTKRTAHGAPRLSADSLQVAVARLLGYRWPAEFDESMELAPEQREWVRRCATLDTHADEDGIVCLVPLRGEPRAAERLQALLAAAWEEGPWTAAQQNALLTAAGFAGRTLEDWLRDGFFEQHCQRFHQRPFIWHVWDGRDDGFGALVNYHRLAAPDGGGRRTLEKLIYAYLGDWIDRQRADQKAGVEGADARLAAAEHLRGELQGILDGEAPYDLFVRWKPLRQQAIGWEPDLDDGVRLNVRPFVTARPLNARGRNASILRVTPNVKWDKDRGKEVARDKKDFPWFWSWDGTTADFGGGPEFDGNRWNDLHYRRAFKEAVRERALVGASGDPQGCSRGGAR